MKTGNLFALAAVLLLAGCASRGTTESTEPAGQMPPGNQGQDLAAMCARIAPDLLASGYLKQFKGVPRLLTNAEAFTNEGAQPINKSVLANRLRVELNKAGSGRLMVVHSAPGADGDLRLAGRVSSFALPGPDGLARTYMRVFLQMVDLETGVNVWNGSYEFAVQATDGLMGR